MYLFLRGRCSKFLNHAPRIILLNVHSQGKTLVSSLLVSELTKPIFLRIKYVINETTKIVNEF